MIHNSGFKLFQKLNNIRFKIFTCSRSIHNVELQKNVRSRTNEKVIQPVLHLFQPGSIIVSTSNSIFDNLCLEEWIYQNYDFTDNHLLLLLLWRNKPAVVVGRHQNLWSEVSVNYCRSHSIDIARRNSGGGTVYHDMQNLNLSFLTSRKLYDRKRNLSFLSQILNKSFSLETEISSREDLVIVDSKEKVSGTASKLSTNNSYHHCTLLVDVNRTQLRQSLRNQSTSQIIGLKSNATKSVPSPILNLNTLNNSLTIELIIDEIVKNFYMLSSSLNVQSKLYYIDPIDENLFSGINVIRERLSSWSWVYGKSPKFSISTSFLYDQETFQLELEVEKGVLSSIRIQNLNSPSLSENSVLRKWIDNCLIGTRFEQLDLIQSIQQLDKADSLLNQAISIAIYDAYKRCLV